MVRRQVLGNISLNTRRPSPRGILGSSSLTAPLVNAGRTSPLLSLKSSDIRGEESSHVRGRTQTKSPHQRPTPEPHPTIEVENADSDDASERDGGKNEPIVVHGRTFTSAVGFRDVCKAVARGAFVRSRLPIIVSLEVHCNAEQQELMVKIMKEEWGDMLLDKPIGGCDPAERQPRLCEVLGKILIKVKRPPGCYKRSRGRDQERNNTGESADGGPRSLNLNQEYDYDTDDDGASLRTYPQGDTGDAPKVKICPVLGDLAIYTHSERFHLSQFPRIDSTSTPGRIYSISEDMVGRIAQSGKTEMLKAYNRDYFVRIYPGGGYFKNVQRAFMSDNPDPAEFWRHGCQMVALNWQTLDTGMMINHAMFDDEGGWVLKPAGYRGHDRHSDMRVEVELEMRGKLNLTVEFLAGQNIPTGDRDADPQEFRMLVECHLHVEKVTTKKATTFKPTPNSTPGQSVPKDLPSAPVLPPMEMDSGLSQAIETSIIHQHELKRIFAPPPTEDNLAIDMALEKSSQTPPSSTFSTSTSGNDSGVECDENGNISSPIATTTTPTPQQNMPPNAAVPGSLSSAPVLKPSNNMTINTMTTAITNTSKLTVGSGGKDYFRKETSVCMTTDPMFEEGENKLEFLDIEGVVEKLAFARWVFFLLFVSLVLYWKFSSETLGVVH